MTRYIWDKQREEFIPASEYVRPEQPGWQVMRDSPGCVDPIEGKWLEGRAARREYMKRHNVVEAGDTPPTPFKNEANRLRYLGR